MISSCQPFAGATTQHLEPAARSRAADLEQNHPAVRGQFEFDPHRLARCQAGPAPGLGMVTWPLVVTVVAISGRLLQYPHVHLGIT